MRNHDHKTDEVLLAEMDKSVERSLDSIHPFQDELSPKSEEVMALLDATGVIMFMGADPEWVQELSEEDPRFLEKIRKATKALLLTLGGEELDEACAFIMHNVSKLAYGDTPDDLKEEIIDALSVRHHLELVLEGARFVLDQEEFPEIGEELLLSWAAFDGNLEPILWQLTPLNPQRELRIEWIAPQHRSRFWWWSQGCSLPADGIDSMITVASMIVDFPEVEEALRLMVLRERDLREILRLSKE